MAGTGTCPYIAPRGPEQPGPMAGGLTGSLHKGFFRRAVGRTGLYPQGWTVDPPCGGPIRLLERGHGLDLHQELRTYQPVDDQKGVRRKIAGGEDARKDFGTGLYEGLD